MDKKLSLMVEAEKRGILPESKKALLAEARKRGLVPSDNPQPSGNTPPPNPSFEVAGRFQPAMGGTPSYAPPDTTSAGINATRALLTNEPTQGLAEEFIRGAPATIGAMAGTLAGAGAMSIPAAGIGGMGGEGLRQSAVGLYATANGKDAPTPGQVVKNMGAQGATQAVGQGAGMALTPAANAVGRGIGNVAEWTAKNIAGVSKQSYEFAKSNISEVAKYVGASPEKANALASQLRTSIDDAAKAGEDYYREVVERIIGDGTNASGVKINVRKSLAESVDGIRKQFGYDAPVAAAHAGHGAPAVKPLEILDEFGQVASRLKPEQAAVKGTVRVTSPDEAGAFAKFADAIKNMKEASPQQVYFLQKDLNGAIENAYGTPLGSALKQLRSGVRQMVNDNAKDLPDLVDANKAYAAAQDLRETAKKLVNSNDLVGEIRRTFSNEFATGKKAAIDEVASRVPKVGQTVDALRGFNAAASFNPYFRTLPQTGMGAGLAASLVGGGAAAAVSPATMALSIPGAMLASPRAQFAALKYGTAAAGKFAASAAKIAPIAAGSAPAIAGAAGSAVQGLLRPAQPQLSPAYQAVLEAATIRNNRIPTADPEFQAIGGVKDARR